MKADQGMTRVGRRLIEDFLLPALNNQRYGDRLKWVDKDKFFFSIRWSHKNAAKWSLEDTVVFQDWDRLKGHFHPEIKGYYMQAKQRFRAALYKLNTVRKVRSADKHTKLYQLVLDNDKKRNYDYPDIKPKMKETFHVCEGIPTSVIRVNESYVPTKVKDTEYMSVPMEVVETYIDPVKHDEHLPCSEDKSLCQLVIQCNESSDSSNSVSDRIIIPQVQKSAGEVVVPEESMEVAAYKEKLQEKPARCQPHIPVQPLPEYRAYHPLQLRFFHSQRHLQQNDDVSDVSAAVEDQDGVLNLSLKSKKYDATSFAISAR